MKKWDVIVIGGGHNGLVNACYLQRAGLDMTQPDPYRQLVQGFGETIDKIEALL